MPDRNEEEECATCADLQREQQRAREASDMSYEVDCRVLYRRHRESAHGIESGAHA